MKRMTQFKDVLQKIIFPNIWITILCVILATVLLIFTFAGGHEDAWFSIPAYVFSAYAMALICVRFWKTGRHVKSDISAMIDRIPLADRYRNDPSFKIHVSLLSSLLINTAYAVMKLFFGVHYRSVWFVTLGVYYFLLALMRFLLLNHAGRAGFSSDRTGFGADRAGFGTGHAGFATDRAGYGTTCTEFDTDRTGFGTDCTGFGANRGSELRRYRLCGIILMLLNISLTGIVILVVLTNEGFQYAGYLIYVMAMYVFYNVTIAAINVVKYRKYHSPLMSAAKVICLASALVSMLSLETAMLAQFGGTDSAQESFRQIMTACTGAGVCIIILGMAIYMIAHATKELKKY